MFNKKIQPNMKKLIYFFISLSLIFATVLFSILILRKGVLPSSVSFVAIILVLIVVIFVIYKLNSSKKMKIDYRAITNLGIILLIMGLFSNNDFFWVLGFIYVLIGFIKTKKTSK